MLLTRQNKPVLVSRSIYLISEEFIEHLLDSDLPPQWKRRCLFQCLSLLPAAFDGMDAQYVFIISSSELHSNAS